MKRAGVISTVILFLLFVTTALAYAQHEEQGKSQQEQHQQGQSPQHQQPAQQPHQKSAQQPHQQPRSNSVSSRLTSLRHARSNRNRLRRHLSRRRPAHRALPMAASTRAASHSTKGRCAAVSPSLAPIRGRMTTAVGASAAAITATGFLMTATDSTLGATTFSASVRLPMVYVGGYPRFQYDGYWVTFVDPWPEIVGSGKLV